MHQPSMSAVVVGKMDLGATALGPKKARSLASGGLVGQRRSVVRCAHEVVDVNFKKDSYDDFGNDSLQYTAEYPESI